MTILKDPRWISLLILLTVVLLVFAGMGDFWVGADGESLAILEEAVRRAAIQCYALEGSYPPNLDYLETHYGLIVNQEAYFYHYEIIGANIMPQIRVLHRWQ
ncbi:hypothetical protein [Anoxynatronum buryatiense]|uniref:Uncharacterized protein n=1 Tax=Anoxynatronum buryatiense TaxID=489973 RepID=A0AA46AJS7_9CLOT|nr:hypothetical protein [Anoxynatronum buryatiense]SMP62887.1 hypothetical protein SAMN06296020_110121 [Anoxynatronum buryatiense]